MSNNSVNIAADNGVALKQCWHIVHWTFASKCQRIETKIQKFSFGGNSIGNICHIARIAPMSFQTAIPHKPRQVRCTLQWLLSGHQHVFISYSQDYIKRQLKKTLNRRSSQLNQYLPYNPHSSFKPIWIFFRRFCVCPSNDTFDKYIYVYICIYIYIYWYWGRTAKTGSLLGIKQT